MVKIIETKDEYDNLLKRTDKLLVIDFFADWCGPCKRIAPTINNWEEEEDFKDVVFVKVNVDENEEAAEAEEVSAMPTFILYKKGKMVEKFVGANEAELRKIILKHK